jgi:hypothetical protein
MAKNNAWRSECDHGVSDQGARQRLLLEGKKMHCEVTRHSLCLEITKLIFEYSSDYGNRGTDYCGSAGPH